MKALAIAKEFMCTRASNQIQTTWESNIARVFANARQQYITANEITNQLTYIKNKFSISAPNCVKEYISGYTKAMWEQMYLRDIEWMFYLDGKLMSGKDVEKLAYEENCKQWGKCVKNEQIFHHPPEYKSPWQRIDMTKCKYVWKGKEGHPMPHKPV